MPKIICTCGETLFCNEIPNPIEFKFISDVDYDKYTDSIDAEELYAQMKSFLKCPGCKNLLIFWNGYANKPTEYKEIQS